MEPILTAAVGRERPSDPGYEMFTPLQLFKALVIKDWYELNDAETALFVQDRLSFRRFVGLREGGVDLGDCYPLLYESLKSFQRLGSDQSSIPAFAGVAGSGGGRDRKRLYRRRRYRRRSAQVNVPAF